MSRMPRINIENALYYISSAGDHNEDIFKEGSDYAMYLELLKRHKKEQGFKLFGYCLAPNQINLLLELAGESTISQIMHGLNSTYIKYFNGKYNKKGHLFQERYKMVLIEKEPNLLDMSAYINLKPRSLGLAQGSAGYPYSSYGAYLYIAEKQKIPEIDIENEVREVTGYIKDKDYGSYLSGFADSDIERIDRDLNKKPIIGSADFAEKVKSKAEAEKEKSEEITQGQLLKSPVTRRFITAGGTAVLILAALTAYLFARSLVIKQNFNKELEKKGTELNTKFTEEKENIYKGLDEKYRADMVSFEALSKRLEIEKKRNRELEEKAKGTSGK